MRVLIATDGDLDAERAAETAVRLAGPDGSITIATVVEVPRTLLSEIRSFYGERSEQEVEWDAEYVGPPPSQPGVSAAWPGDDAVIGRYVADQEARRTAPVAAAVKDRGHEAITKSIEGEEPVRAILELAKEADVLCVGATGRGRFEGLLGSTSTKLLRRAPCSIFLIR